MSGPQRKPDQTAISISMSRQLLADLDARASLLGLTRSQYLAQLARNDIATGGGMVIRELPKSSSPAAHPIATAVVEEAIYSKKKRSKKKPDQSPSPSQSA